VRIEVSFPAFAHRVTVLGSTRNIVATSAGVNSGSASGVRADMWVASPPGPVLRSCAFVVPGAPWGACRGCPIWPTETILPSPAVTRRPPGAKFLYRDAQLLRRSLSLRVSLAILIVASPQFRKYCPASIRRGSRGLSVRQLEFGECAPATAGARVHGD